MIRLVVDNSNRRRRWFPPLQKRRYQKAQYRWLPVQDHIQRELECLDMPEDLRPFVGAFILDMVQRILNQPKTRN